MDTKTPSDIQLYKMLQELREALYDIENGALVKADDGTGRNRTRRTPSAFGLLKLCSVAKRDGRRTNTRPDGGGASTVLDDEGMPMPPLSDPVGESVVTDRPVTDPIIHPTEQVLRLLAGAVANVRSARANLIEASSFAPTVPPEPGCKVHESVNTWVPAHRNQRCRWCYDFWRVEGEDPPKELVKARDAGQHVTQEMVRRALKAVHDKRKRKGKKGRAA